MTKSSASPFFTLTLFAALCVGAPSAGAADFPTVVRQILDSRTDGPLAEMDAERRARMTDCVVATLEALPSGKKRRIVEAVDFEEQKRIFGVIVYENQAEWQKKIASACADIAMDES